MEKSKNTSLQLSRLEDVKQFALILQEYVKDNNLLEKINGKDYVLVDGWKFAGISFGLTAIVSEPEMTESGEITVFSEERSYQGKKYYSPYHITEIESEIKKFEDNKRTKEVKKIKKYKYKCGCDVVNMLTGAKVGYGFAICSNEEFKKIKFDEYAVASMAQTRAIGKAYRNVLGFVMSSAGFAETPAEEMTETLFKDDEVFDQITEEDLKYIAEATDYGTLKDWTCEQVHLLTNEEFKILVRNKYNELKHAS